MHSDALLSRQILPRLPDPKSIAVGQSKLPNNRNVVRWRSRVSPGPAIAVIRITVMNAAAVHIWNSLKAAQERSRSRTTKLAAVNTVSIAGTAESMNQTGIGNSTGTAGWQCSATEAACFNRWQWMYHWCMNHWRMNHRSHQWRRAVTIAAFAKSVQPENITRIHTQRANRKGQPQNHATQRLHCMLPNRNALSECSRRTVANDSANHGTSIYPVPGKVPGVFSGNMAKSKYDGRSVRNVHMAWTSPGSAFLWL